MSVGRHEEEEEEALFIADAVTVNEEVSECERATLG